MTMMIKNIKIDKKQTTKVTLPNKYLKSSQIKFKKLLVILMTFN